jgi:ABC-type sugar transport system ATPase subunit
MRGEIKRLQLELGITSIYVTHDQVEAMTMADRIAVIQDGKLQAYCPPDELYDQPRTVFIAGFVGNPPMNFVDVEVSHINGDFHVHRDGLDFILPSDRGDKAAGKGQVIMGIRAEDVTLADEGIPGEVYIVEPLGRDDLITVRIGEAHIHVLTDPTLRLKIDDNIKVNFNPNKVQFFDPATEKSLLWT